MNKRIEKLRNLIKEKNCDGVLITSRSNTFYFSGFDGSASLMLITPDKAYLTTDFRYIEYAKELCGDYYEVSMYDGDPYKALAEKAMSLNNMAFEDQDVSFSRYQAIKGAFTNIEFIQLQKEIDELRVIKDEHEINIIKKAVEIAEGAFLHILGFIKPGISELEVAAELEYHMKKNGASMPAFETIVASGKRSSLPHGHASEKIIEKGDPVTMDFGALYRGYCSDITRTVFAGKPDDEMIKIYNIVLRAQQEAEINVFEGRSGKEIDKIARDIIYEAGYEGCFGHGLGHGAGIMVHEAPRLSPKSDNIMKNGMITTVEPGIYVENYGGVRIENMVAVNGNTPQILNKSTKELIVI